MLNWFFILSLMLLSSCSKNIENKTLNKQDDQPKIWNLSSIEEGNLDFGIVDFDKQKLLKIDIINDGDEIF